MSTTFTVCASSPSSSVAAPTESASLSLKAYDEAESIFQKTTSTSYFHSNQTASQQVKFLDGGACKVDANCTGFVSYILDKVAPAQYEALRQLHPNNSYPRARSYATFFNSLGEQPKHGWRRIALSDVQRGDLIAWEKHKEPGTRGNTGHVGFVVQKPGREEIIDGKRYVKIEILDCSSVTHFPPEVLPPNTHQTRRDGLGKGCVRLILDDHGAPIGYWEGTFSGERNVSINHPSMSSNIAFARLVD